VLETYPGNAAAWDLTPLIERTLGQNLKMVALSSLGFLRAYTGKQYRRCGVLRKRAWDV